MRRARIAALAAALFLLGVVPVGAGAVTWVVRGAGYGHGVGLSAYGAYGYGLHGFGYRQILHHYFQGIRIAELPRAPLVRVLLTVSSGDVSFTQATAACGQGSIPPATTGRTAADRRCGCCRARGSCLPAAAIASTPTARA